MIYFDINKNGLCYVWAIALLTVAGSHVGVGDGADTLY